MLTKHTGYTDTIIEALDRVGLAGENPLHVEAWMRIAHPTLDGLSLAEFDDEVVIAVGCLRAASPKETAHLAASIL